jgi:D-alanine-D-alanine ligase
VGENFDPLSVIQHSVHRDSLNVFPLFLKPAAEGTGMGITQANKVANQKQLLQVLDDISQRYPTQTILIERFLAGREFTVGIIGTGADAAVIGVREIVFLKDMPEFPVDPTTVYTTRDPALLEMDVYGYDLKMQSSHSPNPQYVDMDLSSDPVAQGAANVALKAWNLLGCRDGGRIFARDIETLRMECQRSGASN